MTRREALYGSTVALAAEPNPLVPLPNAALETSKVVRVLTVETIQPDITAKELAQLMALQVTYMDKAMDAMTPEQRSLIERNSRPA